MPASRRVKLGRQIYSGGYGRKEKATEFKFILERGRCRRYKLILRFLHLHREGRFVIFMASSNPALA